MKHSEEALKAFSSITSMEICKVVEYMLEEKYGKVSEIDKIWLSIIRKDLEMLKIIKDNFIAYKDLYHDGKWQLTLKQKNAFVEGSKEYELLKEWLEK